MKTQVFFIGGGESFDTREEYFAWLQNPSYDPYGYLDATDLNESKFWSKNLELDLGDEYEVIRIQTPSKLNAQYDEWRIWMKHILRHVRPDSICIGHSLGAVFWAKYLAEEGFPEKIAQLHLVSAPYGCAGGFDIDKLSGLQGLMGEVHLYHSKDDEVVEYEHAEMYVRALPQAALHSFSDRGHFLQETFPEIIQNIKK